MRLERMSSSASGSISRILCQVGAVAGGQRGIGRDLQGVEHSQARLSRLQNEAIEGFKAKCRRFPEQGVEDSRGYRVLQNDALKTSRARPSKAAEQGHRGLQAEVAKKSKGESCGVLPPVAFGLVYHEQVAVQRVIPFVCCACPRGGARTTRRVRRRAKTPCRTAADRPKGSGIMRRRTPRCA